MIEVTFRGPTGGPNVLVITQSNLAELTKLPDLRSLHFLFPEIITNGSNTSRPICDSDLTVLRQLRRLHDVDIHGSNISGSGLAYIPMKHLKDLYVDGPDFDAWMLSMHWERQAKV